MKRSILLLSSLAAGLSASTAYAGEVTPNLMEGNPSCESLGYPHGFKVDPSKSGYKDVPHLGKVTWEVVGKYLSWWSDFEVAAVIVKGGPAANVYYNDKDAAFGDEGLMAPLNPGGQRPDLSHHDFCFRHHLVVKKTAETSFKRVWKWTIKKVGEKSKLWLKLYEQVPVKYWVTVDAKAEDMDFQVTGTFSIKNPDPKHTATIETITDELPGAVGPVVVKCDGEVFSDPVYLKPGDTLYCTYTASVLNDYEQTNTVTVKTSGPVGGGSATAPVVFGDMPAHEKDRCVNVSDDQVKGYSLGYVCAGEGPKFSKTFDYTLKVGSSKCGYSSFKNTACFETKDSYEKGCDSHTIAIETYCAKSCTQPEEHWSAASSPTLASAPASGRAVARDGRWDALGEDTEFFDSGMTMIEVMSMDPDGDGEIVLARQLITTWLNRLGEASAPLEVLDAITRAEEHFEGSVPLTTAELTELGELLGGYNRGDIGPGRCPAD